MAKSRTTRRRSKNVASNGSGWIRKDKRHAIYQRDGYRCLYCNKGYRDTQARLQLDHVVPCSKGGSNHQTNLITSCITCNAVRGNKPLEEFIYHLVGGNLRKFKAVQDRINRATSSFIWRKEAKARLAKGNDLLPPIYSREAADFK